MGTSPALRHQLADTTSPWRTTEALHVWRAWVRIQPMTLLRRVLVARVSQAVPPFLMGVQFEGTVFSASHTLETARITGSVGCSLQ
jgi:hypothetical protein